MELDAALGVPLPLSMSTEPEWEWPAVTLDILDQIIQFITCYYLQMDPQLIICTWIRG